MEKLQQLKRNMTIAIDELSEKELNYLTGGADVGAGSSSGGSGSTPNGTCCCGSNTCCPVRNK